MEQTMDIPRESVHLYELLSLLTSVTKLLYFQEGKRMF